MTPTPRTLKIVAASVLLIGFGVSASAGDKKDCDHKDQTAMHKTEASAPSAVLPASAEMAKKEKTVYTFDEALAACQKYGATDLQACINKKTGKAAAPKS
ncbi:MAG: hypothetical protein HKN36_06035 [Hellea sp.]|nr:hypothetical protein [Hellea sp.]